MKLKWDTDMNLNRSAELESGLKKKNQTISNKPRINKNITNILI